MLGSHRTSTISKYGNLIIVLMAILLIYTLLSTYVYSIEPTDLGLVSKLPPTFWIGLALLGCLWFVGKESKRYLAIALIISVAYLFVAPAIIKVPVWLSNSYYPFGEAMLINSSGHLVSRPLDILTSYHYWPIFLYLASTFTLITGMPHHIILKFFPLLTISLYGLLTFIILRKRLKHSYAIVGAAWFLSSFWLRQHYFGPPGIAYVFFLMILLSGSWLSFEQERKKQVLTTRALLLFLFIVITLTHALTSLMSLIMLVALFLTQRLFPKKGSTGLGSLCILCTLFLSSYYAFVTPSGLLALVLGEFGESLSGIMGLSIYQEPSRITGSSASLLNYASSWGIVFLNLIVVVIAIIQVLKNVLLHKQALKERCSVFSLVFLVLLGLFAFTTQYGSHEAYQRAFMFGLVPLAYLCIRTLKSKPKILFVMLVGLIFLNVPAQYACDSFRLATEPQLAGSSFFADSAPENISCLTKFSLYVRYYNPLKRFQFRSIGELPFTTFPNSSTVNTAVNEADYTMLSALMDNYYLCYLGQNPFDQVDFNKLNRVYDNLNFQIFKPTSTTQPP